MISRRKLLTWLGIAPIAIASSNARSMEILPNPEDCIQLFERPDGWFNISSVDAWHLSQSLNRTYHSVGGGGLLHTFVEKVDLRNWWTPRDAHTGVDIGFKIDPRDAEAIFHHPLMDHKIALWRRFMEHSRTCSFHRTLK